jgi:hypothetical protein
MQIVAIKDMSAGNETVGEAWQETKVFSESTPVGEIVAWARSDRPPEYGLHKRLTITVAQD